MDIREFRHEAAIVIVFTEDDLKLIKLCCECHYDGYVKSIAKVGGFLYGWFNMVGLGEMGEMSEGETELTCRWSELDTVGKVLEQESAWEESEETVKHRSDLYFSIVQVLRSMNEETRRQNDLALAWYQATKKHKEVTP